MTLTGKKAVVTLAALGLVAAIRFAAQRSTLSNEGQHVLKTWLAAEYTRAALGHVAPAGPDSASAARLLAANDVSFAALSAHGRGDDVVVRADIRVAGAMPPVGKQVRYFRMRHSLITGWTYQRETTAFAYYTRVF